MLLVHDGILLVVRVHLKVFPLHLWFLNKFSCIDDKFQNGVSLSWWLEQETLEFTWRSEE